MNRTNRRIGSLMTVHTKLHGQYVTHCRRSALCVCHCGIAFSILLPPKAYPLCDLKYSAHSSFNSSDITSPGIPLLTKNSFSTSLMRSLVIREYRYHLKTE